VQVDGEGAGHLLGRVLQELAGRGERGVGDEQVDGAGLRHQPLNVGEVLELSRHRGGTQLLGQRLEDVEPTPAEHQLGTLRGQPPGDGLPEASGRPGDERASSAQIDACGHGDPFYRPRLLLNRAARPW
jgi:hypothetical protein